MCFWLPWPILPFLHKHASTLSKHRHWTLYTYNIMQCPWSFAKTLAKNKLLSGILAFAKGHSCIPKLIAIYAEDKDHLDNSLHFHPLLPVHSWWYFSPCIPIPGTFQLQAFSKSGVAKCPDSALQLQVESCDSLHSVPGSWTLVGFQFRYKTPSSFDSPLNEELKWVREWVGRSWPRIFFAWTFKQA